MSEAPAVSVAPDVKPLELDKAYQEAVTRLQLKAIFKAVRDENRLFKEKKRKKKHLQQ